MKTKLTFLLVAGLLGGAGLGWAQTKAEKKPAADPNAPAAPAEAAPAKVEDLADFNYDDIDLLDLIKSLALRAELNVLFDPRLTAVADVPGQPSARPKVPAFRMSQVTPAQALEAILNNNSLQMIPDPKTKTVRISTKDPTALEPLVTKVVQLKFSSPTNIAPILTTILSARSKVNSEIRTGQLIVSATEKEWEMVSDLIEKIDTATKQVLIEARILETSKNPKSVKGIDWTGTLQGQNFAFGNGRIGGSSATTIPGTPVTTTTTLPSGLPLTTTTSPRSTTASTLTSTLGNGGFNFNTLSGMSPAVGFLNADGVSGVLSFLNSDSDTEVLAFPRTVMLDNQTAKLSVTRAIPIFKITPGSAQSPAGAEITYTNLGTILEVTPRITASSNILLRVMPEVSSLGVQDKQTINGQPNVANTYDIRRIETQVMVPNGATLVMGGLIKDENRRGATKVPLLGDIPLLGWAFRSQSKEQDKKNLLIFITPTIIENGHFQPAASDFLGQGFQTPADEFLKTRPVEKPDKPESFMDSGKPATWGKKK